jgi:hypothetical protein
MPQAQFTAAEVDSLIAVPKIVFKKMEDNRGQPNLTEIRLTYEVRTKDNPDERLRLRMFARLENRPNSAVVQGYPGVSLLWYNDRIRCVAWKLRRESIGEDLNLIEYVSGWYEHQWRDKARDRFVVDINSEITHTDFDSIVRVCLKRWNIEDKDSQLRLR